MAALLCRDGEREDVANEIWAALIGVAGALGGVWYGARLSRNAAKGLLHQQAQAEFAASFTEVLTRLHQGVSEAGQIEALTIMQEDYPRQLTAYVKLRTLLPPEKQALLDAAWRAYTKDEQYDDPSEKKMYRFLHIIELKADEHQYALAAKHIHALLSRAAA